MLPKGFIAPVVASSIILQLTFFLNIVYLYGSLYNNENKVSSLQIGYVDYDGGIVGATLPEAYSHLKGPAFPNVVTFKSSDYPTPADLEHAVWDGRFWAALYVPQNASQKLSTALYEPGAAEHYDANQAITYIWNEVRYPAVAGGNVISNINILNSAARSAWNQMNGTHVSATANMSDPAVAEVVMNPIGSTEVNLMPTAQGTKVLYNTITMVMGIVPNFFINMALNGITAQSGVLKGSSATRLIKIRWPIGLVYGFVGGLLQTGYIWMYREHWNVNSNQFALTWMTFWLYWFINFLWFDFGTAFVPMAFISVFVLSWVLISVTSTIYPFALSAGIYRWAYALPTHEVYTTLITIWGKGAVNKLDESLPILFSWLILVIFLAFLANKKRAGDAAKAAKAAMEAAGPGAGASDTALNAPSDEEAAPARSPIDREKISPPAPIAGSTAGATPRPRPRPRPHPNPRSGSTPASTGGRPLSVAQRLSQALDLPMGTPEAFVQPERFSAPRFSVAAAQRMSSYRNSFYRKSTFQRDSNNLERHMTAPDASLGTHMERRASYETIHSVGSDSEKERH